MTPEGKVKKDGCDILDALGMFWIRVQCGTAKVRGGYLVGNKPGTPDTLASMRLKGLGPMWVWIEWKQVGGKQRKEQLEFEIECSRRGHIYWLVSSGDELLDKIKAAGATA